MLDDSVCDLIIGGEALGERQRDKRGDPSGPEPEGVG